MDNKSNRDRLDALDGLRGLFAVVIMLHNCRPVSQALASVPLMPFIWNYGGEIGNSIFFLLSGFLMTTAYRESIADREISLWDYITRRLRRVYPIYLLTNGLSLLMDILRYGPSAINLQRIVLTALLQSGGGLDSVETYNGPSWFLSALLVCYLVFYAIAYYGKGTGRYTLLSIFAAAWGYLLLTRDLDIPFCYSATGMALLNFFLGCLLAEGLPRLRTETRPKLVAASYGVLMVSLGLMMRYGVHVIGGNSKVAFGMVLCPCVLYLALNSRLAGGILRLLPVRYLGRISVWIWLCHGLIFDVYSYFAAPDGAVGNLSTVQMAGCFATILAVCALMDGAQRR